MLKVVDIIPKCDIILPSGRLILGGQSTRVTQTEEVLAKLLPHLLSLEYVNKESESVDNIVAETPVIDKEVVANEKVEEQVVAQPPKKAGRPKKQQEV